MIKRQVSDFQLDEKLANSTRFIAELPLCRLLISNDNQFPWYLLVPRVANITEIHQLSELQQIQLVKESSALAKAIEQLHQPDKLNIAAIGNICKQLHLHHVARFEHDICWPDPIWGKFPAKPYSQESLVNLISTMQQQIANYF